MYLSCMMMYIYPTAHFVQIISVIVLLLQM